MSPVLKMSNLFSEFELLILPIFIFLASLICHHFKWTPSIVHFNRQLPSIHHFDGSVSIDLVALDRINWGLLPIEKLWYEVTINPSVQNQIIGHCSELTLEQILWIAKNDQINRSFLLRNQLCMRQIVFDNLKLEDYRMFLPELPIYYIDSLSNIKEEIIYEGLVRSNFKISNFYLCDFIQRIPLSFFSYEELIRNPLAINIFDANCIFIKEDCLNPTTHLSQIEKSNPYPLNIPLLECFAKLLFNFKLTYQQQPHQIYFSKILELEDLLQTFPYDKGGYYFADQNHFESLSLNYYGMISQCLDILKDREFFTSDMIYSALRSRDFNFITKPQIFSLICLKDLGPFDQYRILLSILHNAKNLNDEKTVFDTFVAFFEADLFYPWVLAQFFRSYPYLYENIITSSNINSRPLLKFLCMSSIDTNLKSPSPHTMPQVSSLIDVNDLLKAIPRDPEAVEQFIYKNFRLKFADDVVIDLGGPLLDWITEILQLLIDSQLFTISSKCESSANARIFLHVDYFRLIGLLHGKLIQLDSGAFWMPKVSNRIIKNLASLVAMQSNPLEAVILFNDFGFPIIKDDAFNDFDFDSFSAGNYFQVSSMNELEEYSSEFNHVFSSWKSKAYEEYYIALNYFIFDRVPSETVKRLLLLSEFPSLAQIFEASASQICFNTSSCPAVSENISHDFTNIWMLILMSLSSTELQKLIIFVTGQCRVIPFVVCFILIKDINSAQSKRNRLPEAKTCHRELFIYADPDKNQISITNLVDSLKTSIYNYQGFGNA